MGVAEGGEGVVPEGFPDEVAPTPRQVLAASQRALVIDGLYDVDLPQSLGRTTARTRRQRCQTAGGPEECPNTFLREPQSSPGLRYHCSAAKGKRPFYLSPCESGAQGAWFRRVEVGPQWPPEKGAQEHET